MSHDIFIIIREDFTNYMKKVFIFLFSLVCVLCLCGICACGGGKTYELAVVTDVGLLMDGGFNQGTYEGVKNYAEANGISYQYYQPANGSDATNDDRIAAMRLAIKNGAKVIVTPGFLQEVAITTVAKENPDVKFVFVDGWAMGLNNVTAIVYKEQESGYLAGYAAVKEGYTKLGGTFGGGGSNPACNRFAYGFIQGANDAALADEKAVEINLSFKFGDSFSASTELETQISGWYTAGTEVVFACGGSMVQSVISAAKTTANGKIIGVDVDQSNLSDRVITSAVKGLTASVELVLKQYYDGEWDAKLADVAQNLGAKDNATGLPTAEASWKFANFTLAQYNELLGKIKDGTVTPKADVPGDCSSADYWAGIDEALTAVTINYESNK